MIATTTALAYNIVDMPSGVYKHKSGYKRDPAIFNDEWRKKISESKKKNPVRYWLGKKRSPETVAKMVAGMVGYKHSEETKKKMLGRKAWNKNMIGFNAGEKSVHWKGGKPHCKNCKKEITRPPSTRKDTFTGLCSPCFNSTHLKGENNNNWNGGVSKINKTERQWLMEQKEYKLWRKAVFERDNYMCIFGGKEHGSKLEADHIKPWSQFPELRYAIDNGRTLCPSCHKKTDTYGYKANRTLTVSHSLNSNGI